MALPVMLLPWKVEMSGRLQADSYRPPDILLRYTNLIDQIFFFLALSFTSHCSSVKPKVGEACQEKTFSDYPGNL